MARARRGEYKARGFRAAPGVTIFGIDSMEVEKYLFVSYAREDIDRVRPICEAVRLQLAFRALPVELWVDVSNLKPGEQWNISIEKALRSSIGFLFFVSPELHFLV